MSRRLYLCSPRSRAVAAFTLIEILIAITVLAIGLLGLGAVFPVVIREQRIAIQQMEAPPATDHASAVLRTHGVLNTPDPSQAFAPGEPMYDASARWKLFLDDIPGGLAMLDGPIPTMPDPDDQLLVYESPASHDPKVRNVADWLLDADGADGRKGDLTFEWGGAEPIRIPLAQRLLPTPSESDSIRPEYVWDLALFRPVTGNLKAVIFVRPIDANIRVPNRFRDGDPDLGRITLTDVLLARFDVMANERRLPISVARRIGRPTGDGNFDGDYAPIVSATCNASTHGLTRDLSEDRAEYDTLVVELDPMSYPDNARSLLGRVGQLIAVQRDVDEVVVHRVTAVVQDDRLGDDQIALRVTPSLQPTRYAGATPEFEYKAALYSPVPPVDVRVVDLGVSP